MQRNKTAEPSRPPAQNASNVVTRSRSASSSQSSNSGSSSSGSSSSGSSSSSSSSGSGSDSSSSDTEASRASSQQSRRSRASQKSASVTPIKSNVAKTPTGPAKKQTPAPSKATPAVTATKTRISGTVTNTKTIPRARGTAPKNRKATPPPKNTDAVWTTDDDNDESTNTESVTSTPIKKVGSKPPGKIVTIKKPPPATPTPKATAAAAKKKKASPVTKQPAVKKTSPNTAVTKNQKAGANATASRKLMKSIFSPENSSEGSGDEKKAGPSKSNSMVNGTPKIIKGKPPPRSRKKEIQANSDAVKGANKGSASSSQSSQSSSSSGSSSSESGSGTESKRKPAKEPIVKEKDASPASGTSVRKRPLTRRQRRTVHTKTIPTTTAFNHTSLTKVQNQTQACWDSDFSDEPKSLARVPTKSTQKMRVKPPDPDEDEIYDRERKCPFPCCDSTGHLSGKFPTHYMLTTCPKYHGFTLEECKENADERSKREIERKKYYVPNQPHFKKPAKLSQESKNWMTKSKELKAQDTLGGLCSQYDLSLWNDALAIAAAKIETEQGESLSHRSVAMGRWEMSCWCQSPYPEPLCHCRRLFICEFCLKPVQSGTVLRRHCAKCVWRHPPGDEIYRKDRLSVWEVDGKSQKTYCQNLCLLAKCFLDHKTLYLDVDPFLFYVMTLADSTGCHIVGYFSKEKNQSFLNYNVSCILTLPPYMRQGFGRLLIEFSYLLTRVEGKVGSPEKPLSDLGLISYRSYWKDAVLRRMCACASREMSIKDLSNELGVSSADLISTLQFLGMLKYWKGKHLILKKQDVLEDYLERVRRRGEQRSIDSSCLRWRPYQPPPEPQS